jgi:hypothetical protein
MKLGIFHKMMLLALVGAEGIQLVRADLLTWFFLQLPLSMTWFVCCVLLAYAWDEMERSEKKKRLKHD